MLKQMMITAAVLLFVTSPAFSAETIHTVDEQDLQVKLNVNPDLPKKGERVRVDIQTLDKSGKNAAGVEDVTVVWSMPKMGHDVGTKKAVPTKGEGNFYSTLEIMMPGQYQIIVKGRLAGEEWSVERTFTAGKSMR